MSPTCILVVHCAPILIASRSWEKYVVRLRFSSFWLSNFCSLAPFRRPPAKRADIEDGLHELRRRLRWMTIEFQALSGFVQLQPGGLKDEAEIEIQFSEALDAIHASEDQNSQVTSLKSAQS